jgi:PTS system fructose-specific IIA component/PTS system nitrogen regulatory IIA component
MRMTSFLKRDAILPAVSATSRDDAIAEMVQALQAAGAFDPSGTPDIIAAVLRREQLGSTGIGRGIAIPHSRHASVSQLVGALALCPRPEGIGFDAIDGEPVHVMVLLISPQDQPGHHLRALDSVVQALRDDAFLARLRACQTADEIWGLLSDV